MLIGRIQIRKKELKDSEYNRLTSLDNKANVKVGPFSRGGYSRQEVKASDHDFHPDTVLKPFGIFLPAYDENYF